MNRVFKYFLPYRPPAPGTIPKGFVRCEEWADRPYCAEVGRHVWGFAEYERELTEQEVNDYELIRAPEQSI
jgi:hypothetical protein